MDINYYNIYEFTALLGGQKRWPIILICIRMA